MKVQAERLFLQQAALLLTQFPCLHHLRQHHVAALAATFRLTHWVVVGGVLAHAHQRGALIDGKVLRGFTKIDIRGGFDAHRVVQKVKIIQVKREHFLLGVMPFEFYGYHPLNGFLQKALHRTFSRTGVELLGQLLRDGAAAACLFLPQHAAFYHSTHQCPCVDAGMLVETYILGGHKSVEHAGGNAVVGYKYTVFVTRPRSQQTAVGRDDLRCVSADGALQLTYGRHITYPPTLYAPHTSHNGQQEHEVGSPHEDQEFLSHICCRQQDELSAGTLPQ